jgi:hypothetical protein
MSKLLENFENKEWAKKERETNNVIKQMGKKAFI